MSVIFQGQDDPAHDPQVYATDLALADQAEGLGFDSVWTVEHHFTPYTMCPDPLQFLTYMAGRTRHVKLGSMVVVLPWHDPVRVVEQVSMLDVLSGGRLILGLGRGLGRVEFDGFRIPMDEARGRFVESAEIVLQGLQNGYVEYEGQHFRIPRRAIRPTSPYTMKGRTYAAAVSPESVKIMSDLEVGLLIIPQKPWPQVSNELADYRDKYRAHAGTDAPPPVVAGWVFCDPDPVRAEEMARQYIGDYYQSVVRHYEFLEGHLATTKGYEYYGKLTESLKAHGTDGSVDFFCSLQVWGTPDQCLQRIEHIRELTGTETFIGVCSYAGMPAEESARNYQMFAGAIRPTLQEWAPAKREPAVV